MYQTVDQIATEYNRHPMYIRKLARNGVLAAIKVNGEWHIDADIARQYFSNRRHQTVVELIAEVATINSVTEISREYAITNRTYGVEMEVTEIDHETVTAALRAAGIETSDEYSHYNHETPRSWKVMSDSSIRGQGCEIVSPILRGEAGMATLETVCNALVAAGAKINKSCGLHVHIGTDDLNVEAVRNIVKSYQNNYALISSFMAPSRVNNSYCKPYDSYDIANFENCTTIEQLSERSDSRYHTVNLEAYTRHGTVEFRQHQGSVEFAKISNWVRFVLALAETAKTESMSAKSNVEELVRSLGLNETSINYFTSRANHFARA
jgi:hypothetical protein